MSPTVSVVDDPAAVEAACAPLRRRILELLDAPDSAVGLARRLGLPRQRVNYHLRALERAGLVVLVEERPRRGSTERIVARVADHVVVDPGLLTGALPPRDRAAAAGAVAAAGEVIREVAVAAAGAAASGRRLATATVDAEVRFAGPADLRAFLDDLAELCARYDRPGRGAATHRVVAVTYPRPASEDDDGVRTAGRPSARPGPRS